MSEEATGSDVIDAQKSAYWNSYYASRTPSRIPPPSQFAAFVVQEAADAHLVIEVGCGTGRDSLFFATHGRRVVAIDGSAAAVKVAQDLQVASGLHHVDFVHATVGSSAFGQAVMAARESAPGPAVFYARFFLHAITEAEEDSLISVLGTTLRSGDVIALEYRTIRDASGEKETAAHYRRFIEPPRLYAKFGRDGFNVEYAVEGFGFAKYKQDDAYVARCLLRKA